MNTAIIQRLARYLSVVETRSGEAIGNELGCSRTAVWKYVESLRSLGIEIDAIAGQGYLLREPLELLDSALIVGALDPLVHKKLGSLNIESSLDSTNSALHRVALEDQHSTVILAEHQSAPRHLPLRRLGEPGWRCQVRFPVGRRVGVCADGQ